MAKLTLAMMAVAVCAAATLEVSAEPSADAPHAPPGCVPSPNSDGAGYEGHFKTRMAGTYPSFAACEMKVRETSTHTNGASFEAGDAGAPGKCWAHHSMTRVEAADGFQACLFNVPWTKGKPVVGADQGKVPKPPAPKSKNSTPAKKPTLAPAPTVAAATTDAPEITPTSTTQKPETTLAPVTQKPTPPPTTAKPTPVKRLVGAKPAVVAQRNATTKE